MILYATSRFTIACKVKVKAIKVCVHCYHIIVIIAFTIQKYNFPVNHANISIVFFQLSAIVATLAITFAVIAVAAVLRSGHPASALRPFVGRAIIPVYLVGTFTESTGLYTEWIAVAIGFFDLALYVLGTASGIVAIDIGHLFGFQL